MANTPNLGIPLDTYGKVGLEQAITESLKRVGQQLGIEIPIRTEGYYALRLTYEQAMDQIGATLGIKLPVDPTGFSGLKNSLARNLLAIDAAIGGGVLLHPLFTSAPLLEVVGGGAVEVGAALRITSGTIQNGSSAGYTLVAGAQSLGTVSDGDTVPASAAGRAIRVMQTAIGAVGSTPAMSLSNTLDVLPAAAAAFEPTATFAAAPPDTALNSLAGWSRIGGEPGHFFRMLTQADGALVGQWTGNYLNIGSAADVFDTGFAGGVWSFTTETDRKSPRSAGGVIVAGTDIANHFRAEHTGGNLALIEVTGGVPRTLVSRSAGVEALAWTITFLPGRIRLRTTHEGIATTDEVPIDLVPGPLFGIRRVDIADGTADFRLSGIRVADTAAEEPDFQPGVAPANAVVGMNTGLVSYSMPSSHIYRDLTDRMEVDINGGTHSVAAWSAQISDPVHLDRGPYHNVLRDAGIIDRDGLLLVYPDDAESINYPLCDFAHPGMAGEYVMRLAGPDFTWTTAGSPPLISNVRKNADGPGVHRFTITPEAAAQTGECRTRLDIHKAGFQPMTSFSARKVADTGAQIFTNEHIADASPFSVIRTMDTTRANEGGTYRRFDQHSRKGFSIYAEAELANRTGAAPWITPSWISTPEDVGAYVALLDDLLDPSIPHIVLDPLNESVWNNGFNSFGVMEWRGVCGGYGAPDGRGPIYDPATLRRMPTPETRVIPEAVSQGEEFFIRVSGGGQGVFRAKRARPAGTPLPPIRNDSTIVENEDFVRVSDSILAARRYGGVLSYRMAKAAKAAASRPVLFVLNVQVRADFSAGSGDVVTATFRDDPATPSACIDIMDAVGGAPYLTVQPADMNAVWDMPEGEQPARLLTLLREQIPANAAAVSAMIRGFQRELRLVGRGHVVPRGMCYEAAANHFYESVSGRSPAKVAALQRSLTSLLQSQEYAQLSADYIDAIAGAGSEVTALFIMTQFAEVLVAGGRLMNWGFIRGTGDTGYPPYVAARERALHYKARAAAA